MLSVSNLSKSFGPDLILSEISFNLNPGQRLGLVGPNGCGKTTLLRIIAGQERPDKGSFHFPTGAGLGYLPQGLTPAPDDTLGGFLAANQGDPEALAIELSSLAEALAGQPDRPGLQAAYDDTLARLERAEMAAGQAPQVLGALGLDSYPFDTPVAHLSGGQKTRLALAAVLLGSPGLLLLDEPTNHLDIDMLEWLEDWLAHSPLTRRAAALIVSHDRVFLDRTVTGILELDPATHRLRAYPGNYSAYLEAKLAEQGRQLQMYSDWQEELVRLRRAATMIRGLAVFKKGGKADTADKFAKGFFANRSRATVKRAKSLERRLDVLLTDERVDKPRPSWQMKLDFAASAPPSGKDVLSFSDLSIGYGQVVLAEGLSGAARLGQRIALIGPNGAGKTTLLRTLTGRLEPLAGQVRLGPSTRLGYMSQEGETLDPASNAFEVIRKLAPLPETEARAFLHQFLFTGDEVFTPVGKLSYGERARLTLASLAVAGCNLLLLDEPINHLDLPSRARFEQALSSFDGTVIAVVHDRYFISGFATHIWELRDGELKIQQAQL
jgi:ATP-binding cassette subfamily F protein 3